MPLTKKRIHSLTKRGRYGDGHGLYLQVFSAENRSWLFRYRARGHERWMGLGPVHTVQLEEARELARLARKQVSEGFDPIDERKKAKAALALASAKHVTFECAAQSYFEQKSPGWKNEKHRAQFLSTLRRYAFPIIGKMSVADVDTPSFSRSLNRSGGLRPKPRAAFATGSKR